MNLRRDRYNDHDRLRMDLVLSWLVGLGVVVYLMSGNMILGVEDVGLVRCKIVLGLNLNLILRLLLSCRKVDDEVVRSVDLGSLDPISQPPSISPF